jgi:hypothetical protein
MFTSIPILQESMWGQPLYLHINQNIIGLGIVFIQLDDDVQ